jgi:hypothetical protein
MPTNQNPQSLQALMLEAQDLLYPVRCELKIIRRALRTVYSGGTSEDESNGFDYVLNSIETDLDRVADALKGGLSL